MAWNIGVNRERVLSILKENRKNHKGIVLEAWAGYHVAVINELERRLEEVKKNTKADVYVRLPQPEDHTDEYDTIINMLEMSDDATITLGAPEFRSYVEDKWDWKQRFLMSNSNYSETASSSLD